MTISRSTLRNKENLRKEILTRLRSQTKAQVLKKSAAIKRKLFELKEFKKARCVVFFVSMEEEVYTHRMIDESIRMGKRVGVPIVVRGEKELIISQITDRKKELERGPYGIGQPRPQEARPISFKDIELILIPGVAFDKKGNRLGRGKGFYDRFLSKLPERARTIGLCFDFQVIESVPVLPYDIPVQTILTNN